MCGTGSETQPRRKARGTLRRAEKTQDSYAPKKTTSRESDKRGL